MPMKLPIPAAAAMPPRASVASQASSTVACTRNAEKMVRNPASPRSAAVARNAVTT